MIDRASILAAAHAPHAWTAFITSDTTHERLNAVLNVLETEDQTNGILTARQAHVLMLLQRPRDADLLLITCTHRMCRAQRLLALAQLGKLERNPRLFVDVASHTPHFGTAVNALELEAQMRLDYALCVAHAELGSEYAVRHADRAVHVARLIGCEFMTAAVTSITAPQKAKADPNEHARRLGRLALDVRREGNAPLAHHLALTARSTLIRSGLYAELVVLADSLRAAVPDAAAWSDTARTLVDPTVPPPPLDPADSLSLLAHAYHSSAAALRAEARMDRGAAAHHAVTVLNLPSWPSGNASGSGDVAYRCLHALAQVRLGQMREAVVALRGIVQDGLHQQGPVAGVYVGATALALVGRGAAYLDDFTPLQAYSLANSALSRMPHDLTLSVSTRLASVMPNATLVLSRSVDAPAALLTTAAGIALLSETHGLLLGGRRVKGAPYKGAAALRDLAEGTTTLQTSARVTLHRYQRALDALDATSVRGVAFEWRVARIEAHVARHGPVSTAPHTYAS
ncbi:hypothetical protein [Deinococcus sp. 23YEL01]|uniref:hypothetical protein n=1 Tax=Deinococcus sp. 23YEL01 TaxID=2745871 RepID=UPI001E5B6C40|nr:hypothetical protein [Deinococcus sp. 23YEL01]MCD0168031.1 hypothetical protein [Deinococcus sp. 23YEL01]